MVCVRTEVTVLLGGLFYFYLSSENSLIPMLLASQGQGPSLGRQALSPASLHSTDLLSQALLLQCVWRLSTSLFAASEQGRGFSLICLLIGWLF